LMIC